MWQPMDTITTFVNLTKPTTFVNLTKPMIFPKLLQILWLAVLFLLLSVVSGFSQSNKATISGTVKDSQGAVVTGAKVVVTNVATNADREVTTNEEGFYRVPLLDIGT